MKDCRNDSDNLEKTKKPQSNVFVRAKNILSKPVMAILNVYYSTLQSIKSSDLYIKFIKLSVNSKFLFVLNNLSELLPLIFIFVNVNGPSVFKLTGFSLFFILFLIYRVIAISHLSLKKILEYLIGFVFFLYSFIFEIIFAKKENYIFIIVSFIYNFYFTFLLIFYYQLVESKKHKNKKYLIPFILIISSFCFCVYSNFNLFSNLILISLLFNLADNHINYSLLSILTEVMKL